MEALLIAIYAFFVWLIFIKFKWLPWNTTSQVTVVIIPIVALTALVLTLNVVAQSIGLDGHVDHAPLHLRNHLHHVLDDPHVGRRRGNHVERQHQRSQRDDRDDHDRHL